MKIIMQLILLDLMIIIINRFSEKEKDLIILISAWVNSSDKQNRSRSCASRKFQAKYLKFAKRLVLIYFTLYTLVVRIFLYDGTHKMEWNGRKLLLTCSLSFCLRRNHGRLHFHIIPFIFSSLTHIASLHLVFS